MPYRTSSDMVWNQHPSKKKAIVLDKKKNKEKQKLCLSTTRALHQQLDDDKDGTIEPSETGDFIKGDLKVRTGNVSDRLLALETQGCTACT
jgi:hypothetical protein